MYVFMKKLFFVLLTAVLMVACNSKSSEVVVYDSNESVYSDMAIEEDMEIIQTAQEAPPPPPAEAPLQVEKKIIKTGAIHIEVIDLSKEKSKVDSLTRQFNAYYDNERMQNLNHRTSYELKIRIPVASFEKFIAAIEKGGNKITYKDIDAQDVTEQFIDLETRLDNKRKYMARYQDLLRQAKTVKDILEIQENIRNIEEEVESVMGRLKYLSNQTSFSTLDITLTQKKEFKYTPERRENFFEKLKQSLIGGWYLFVDFIYILVYNWVWIVVISVGVYFWVKIRRKRKNAGK
jgi:hypothetical protein